MSQMIPKEMRYNLHYGDVRSTSSHKHTYIISTPLNPAFI